MNHHDDAVVSETVYYLACPYSHPDPDVRRARFGYVNEVAAAWMRRGRLVYSPISHTHPLTNHDLPGGWEYWRRFDLTMLNRCDAMLVLMLDGWRESVGVQAEIAHAKRAGIPITYLEWTGNATDI